MPDLPESPLLEQIHTGMTLFDRDGEQLGEIDGVFQGLPEEHAARPPEEAVTPGAADAAADMPATTPPPMEDSASELQGKLRQSEVRRGYVRVAAGDVPEQDRYIPVEQIDRVEDWRVFAKQSKEELGW